MSQVPAAISKCGGKVGALCSDLSPYLPSRAPSGPRELCIRRHEQESKTLASGATIEDRPSVSHSHLCRSRAIPGEDTRVGSVSRWHRQADVDTEAAMSYSIPCTMYMYLSLHLRAFFCWCGCGVIVWFVVSASLSSCLSCRVVPFCCSSRILIRSSLQLALRPLSDDHP